MKIREGLSFDDVLLVPQHSELPSRANVSLDIKLGGLQFNHPIIPANMKSIATPELARSQAFSGGLAIMHRFTNFPVGDYIRATVGLPMKWRVGVSLGVHEDDRQRFRCFRNEGCVVYCVDVAHGDSDLCCDMVSWMRQESPTAVIIAGNVATGLGAMRLWNAGADVVKVGVGPGSLCTTRIETGCGVPQLTALMDVHAVRKIRRMSPMQAGTRQDGIIADGGIKNAGDCVKALCFADAVMCGRVFAGCDECGAPNPGNANYKQYEGSSTHKTSHVEGVRARVPLAGSYAEVLNRVLEGVRSGCSYQGCALVTQLQDDPELVKITAAGLAESYPHDVVVVKE